MRRLALAALVLAAGAAAVLGGGFVWLSSIDWNARRDALAERLSAALGKPLRIDGALHLELDWNLQPEIAAHDLVIGAPDDDIEATLGLVELEFAVIDLLRGRYHFDEFQIYDGEVAITVDDEADAEPAAEREEPRQLDVHLDRGSIENVRIVQRDAARGVTTTTLIERGSLRSGEDDWRLRARGRVGALPFDLAGRLDRIEPRGAPAHFAFALAGEIGGARVDANGRIDRPADLRGAEVRLRATAESLASLGEPLGWELPASGPVELDALLTSSSETTTVHDFDARVGSTRFRGDLVASHVRGERARFETRLETPHLQLADVGLAPDGASAADDDEDLDPDAPLGFERLRSFDGTLELAADRATGREGFDLAELRARLSLDRGVLSFDPVTLDYEGGSVHATARIDARTAPTRLALEARGENVRVARVLAQLEEEPSIRGLLDVELRLSSRGDSLAEAMGALQGSAHVRLDEGEIATRWTRRMSPDLWNQVLSPSWRAELTRVRCLHGDLTVRDGVAVADTLLLDTDQVTLTATGSVT